MRPRAWTSLVVTLLAYLPAEVGLDVAVAFCGAGWDTYVAQLSGPLPRLGGQEVEQPTTRASQGDRREPLTLSSYVAALAARRLVGRHEPLREPEGEQFTAAALFADISGFTALTERLARTGPGGVEELTELLNGCFGQLVQLVVDHGGDVVKFAGDALLALWPADAGLSAVTARAASCGLAMQRVLHASELAAGTRLSVRVGIGVGQVSAAHLGGVLGRWEFVVGGPAITQTCGAEQLARPGDVVLSAQALDQVRELCAGEPMPAGSGRTPGLRVTMVQPLAAAAPLVSAAAVQAAGAALRGYVPGAILARLDAGQSAWLSELRHLSVLFLRLPELDDIAPDTLRQANDLVREVQEALYEYEGSVNKLGVDDKGTTMVAAFGLPPVAHEDDPVRAVRAALGIRAQLDRRGVRHAIGIATGRAFCGSVGSSLRREYTMIGGVVNLAARLMQTALDDVVCDGATRQEAEAKLAFEGLPPRRVKGWAEPIAVFRPGGLSRARTPSRSLVGRTRERGLLTERLGSLRSGHGGVLLIEGEAGIGKSRLLDDLVDQAAAQHVRTLIGAADAIRTTTPYHAWRPVFESLFDLIDVSEPGARRTRVLDWLRGRPDLERLAPLLGDVLPLDLTPDELIGQLQGQVRADNTRGLLVGALRAAADEEQPLLLVLEDAHWCDSASWALAWLVSQRVPKALLVLALRPLVEPVPDEYQRLRQARAAQQLRLDPLPADEVAALVGQRLGVSSVPPPVADLIGEHAGGNPFFSEELAYTLRDTGVITITNGTCRIAPGADLQEMSLPDTVQGVVLARIDRLAPPQQLTLKVASVIGRSFAYRLLHDVYPIAADRPSLSGQLDSLQRRSLVLLEAPEPELAWMFKHVITRDVAYELMVRAQRRALHRAIAEWYEQHHEAELPRFYPLLAHHWSQTEVAAKAVQFQGLAGEQALDGGAYQEAMFFLAAALERDPAPPQDGSAEARFRRARWERQLAEAHLGLGDTRQGRVHLGQALDLLGTPLPTTLRRLVGSVLRQLALQAAHRVFPNQPVVGRGRRPPEERLEASRAYMRLTEVFWFANDVPALVHASLQALNLAERAGPSPELARAYSIMCLAAGSVPLHPLARAYAQRAEQTARRVGQLWPLGYVRFITCVYLIGAARWAELHDALQEAEGLLERAGDLRALGDSWSVQGLFALYRGRFESAAAAFSKLYERGARNENVQHQVWACIGWAECELRAGRTGEAARLLETALELLVEHPDRAEQVRAYGLLAVVRLRRGEETAARAAASSAASLIARLKRPTSFYLLEGYAGVAEVYLSLWENGQDSREVRQAAQRACLALRRFARVFPIGEPRARLWSGRLLYFWLFCRIRGCAQARPGSGGHRPPRASMASAMSASGERNPNAIRVSSRSLVLTDSTRPLDRPYSRVAWMPARWSVIDRASFTKAGIRQRRAQESQASSSATARAPLSLNTNRSSSLSR
jgi:class 3 adenylate cyclase/tetratricopeptide (TPR) repeat protein